MDRKVDIFRAEAVVVRHVGVNQSSLLPYRLYTSFVLTLPPSYHLLPRACMKNISELSQEDSFFPFDTRKQYCRITIIIIFRHIVIWKNGNIVLSVLQISPFADVMRTVPVFVVFTVTRVYTRALARCLGALVM